MSSSNEVKLSNIDLNVDEKKDEDKVDPWNVTAASETGIDYNKLICKSILNNCFFRFRSSN